MFAHVNGIFVFPYVHHRDPKRASRQNFPWSNKDMFLDYGGDKEFVVKGYVDASFNTYPNDSE